MPKQLPKFWLKEGNHSNPAEGISHHVSHPSSTHSCITHNCQETLLWATPKTWDTVKYNSHVARGYQKQ